MEFPLLTEHTLYGRRFVKRPPIGVFDEKRFKELGPGKRTVKIDCEKAMESLARTSCLYIANPSLAPEIDDEYARLLPPAFNKQLVKVQKEDACHRGNRDQGLEKARPYPSRVARCRPGHEPPSPPQGEAGKDTNERLMLSFRELLAQDIEAFPILNRPTEIPDGLRASREAIEAWEKPMFETAVNLHYMIDTGCGLPQGAMLQATNIGNGPCLVAPTKFSVDPTRDVLWACKQYPHLDDSWGTLHGLPFHTKQVRGPDRMDAVLAWMPNGQSFLPEVPQGMLLFQAGCYLQCLLGGREGKCKYPVEAGMHAAVVTPWMLEAAIRHSHSLQEFTEFSRYAKVYFIQPQTIKPMGTLLPFLNEVTAKAYPPLPIGLLMLLSFYGTGLLDKCPEFPLAVDLPLDLEASPRIQEARRSQTLGFLQGLPFFPLTP